MASPFGRLWERLAGNRQTVQRPIIVVSGLPRSGTSMMMNMLAAGGMEMVTDQLRQADEDNPNGYFEFEKVKSLAEDASWMGIACGKAIKIIVSLLCYLPSAYTYKVILMERNLQDVLASQQIMLHHRGEDSSGPDDETMGELLTQHLNDAKAWLDQQTHIDVLVVRHADAMSKPLACAQRVRQFVDQPLDVNAMAAVVDPSLHRNKAFGDHP
ncbi:MAG: sulfotransferase [Candidatus Tectomicrobia bacterium]|nr:sulfotransferase [Candidatus Tectomicrobia bacterium]